MDKDKQTKESEKVAENNYEPEKKKKSEAQKDLETVHEQINDTFNQGTLDDKKKQQEDKKEDKKEEKK